MRIFLARLPDGSHASRKTESYYSHAVVWQVTQADVDRAEAAYNAALACTDEDRVAYVKLDTRCRLAKTGREAAKIHREIERHPAHLLATDSTGAARGQRIISGLRAKVGQCGVEGFCGSLRLAEKLRIALQSDPYRGRRTYTIVETIPT
jgi:hypothetical protein